MRHPHSLGGLLACKIRGTRLAFLATRLLGTPFWCLLGLLVFILYKHLHLDPWQITALIALKPTSALLSPYWSQAIHKRPDRLIPRLVIVNLLRHLPFLFVPWITSPWLLILAFGSYMTLTRASIPPWLEVFKQNLPEGNREKLVSQGTLIDYVGNALFAVILGLILDRWEGSWRFLFPSAALLGILATPFIALLTPKTPLLPSVTQEAAPPEKTPSLPWKPLLKDKVFQPWRQVWNLLSTNKGFALFQLGFMLGGGGLMILQPALPKFFVDALHLSYLEMGLALNFCKALGVVVSNSFWIRLFRNVNIFQMSALVLLTAALFPLILLSSSLHLILLYLAFAFYGVMQAGSELSWHMSGLVFAKEKESSIFTITGVLTVGIRGSLIPALGSLLLVYFDPSKVMLIGASLCFLGSLHFMISYKSLKDYKAFSG